MPTWFGGGNSGTLNVGTLKTNDRKITAQESEAGKLMAGK
jgi:hypothetical protein